MARLLLPFYYINVLFGSFSPAEDFLFPKNVTFAHTGYKKPKKLLKSIVVLYFHQIFFK